METLVEALLSGKHSLVLENDGRMLTCDSRGVKDLYDLLTRRPDVLCGARIADKVVGKGAAALMIAGGVERLHALVVSRPALDLLETSSVEVTFDELVPNIINRSGSGICPVELLCHGVDDPSLCVSLIGEFLRNLKQ